MHQIIQTECDAIVILIISRVCFQRPACGPCLIWVWTRYRYVAWRRSAGSSSHFVDSRRERLWTSHQGSSREGSGPYPGRPIRLNTSIPGRCSALRCMEIVRHHIRKGAPLNNFQNHELLHVQVPAPAGDAEQKSTNKVPVAVREWLTGIITQYDCESKLSVSQSKQSVCSVNRKRHDYAVV